MELRLTCLEREGCDARAQCYFVSPEADLITTAPMLEIEMYVTGTSRKIDTAGMEAAVAQWLDLDPVYVSVALFTSSVNPLLFSLAFPPVFASW